MKQPYMLTQEEEQKAQRVAYLVSGFLRQGLTEEELNELDDWIVESDENELLFEELTDPQNIEAGIRDLEGIDTEQALQKIKIRLRVKEPAIPPRKKHYWAYGIAASVLLIAGLFFFTRNTNKNAIAPAEQPAFINDVAPGGNKATLALSDGSIIDLEKQRDGLVKNKQGIQLNKLKDGELVYNSQHNTSDGAAYNILATPRGGQYKVTLPDGTIVWLNAASSLKYPVQFTGKERIVELKGEAYFDVAKNPNRPFRVKTRNETEVLVTGTQFNINAYGDEEGVLTTLIEGGVTLQQAHKNTTLKPGEQAAVYDNGEISMIKNANLAQATGWKDGQFVFKDAGIQLIMRQVSRWYEVDVEYTGNIPYHFNATIERNVPVSKLLQLLEMTDNVHFRIMDNKILVQP